MLHMSSSTEIPMKRSIFFNKDCSEKKDPTVPLRDILIYKNDYLKGCEVDAQDHSKTMSIIKRNKVIFCSKFSVLDLLS